MFQASKHVPPDNVLRTVECLRRQQHPNGPTDFDFEFEIARLLLNVCGPANQFEPGVVARIRKPKSMLLHPTAP